MLDAEFLRLWVAEHLYRSVKRLSEATGEPPAEILKALDDFVTFPGGPGWFFPIVREREGEDGELSDTD